MSHPIPDKAALPDAACEPGTESQHTSYTITHPRRAVWLIRQEVLRVLAVSSSHLTQLQKASQAPQFIIGGRAIGVCSSTSWMRSSTLRWARGLPRACPRLAAVSRCRCGCPSRRSRRPLWACACCVRARWRRCSASVSRLCTAT